MGILQLVNQLAAREESLRRERFLAPSVGGGRVRVSLDGLVRTFRTRPRNFEGWGIFRPADDATAELSAEATLPQVASYLSLLRPLRVRLAERLSRRTWLAFPANAEEAQRRFGTDDEALRVHLVAAGARFEPVVAYADGRNWFCGEPDRRADARATERLRELLRQGVEPRGLNWKGITPEMRAVYAIAAGFAPELSDARRRLRAERARQLEAQRLNDALALNGGRLVEHQEDEEGNWRVFWQARDGAGHVSTVARRDLTVVSAGICLSGLDRDFDLQSLVGVVAGAWDDD